MPSRRDPAVHRVDRDRGGPQPVTLLEAGQLAVRVEAAEQHDVGLRFGRERRADLRVELGDQVGGVLRLGRECRRRERRHAGLLRVGVAEPGIEPGAAQHDEQPVLALVPEEDLHARHVHRGLEPLDDGLRLGVGDAPGAPVGDRAVGRRAWRGCRGRRRRRQRARSRGRPPTARRDRARTARGRSRTSRGGRGPTRA